MFRIIYDLEKPVYGYIFKTNEIFWIEEFVVFTYAENYVETTEENMTNFWFYFGSNLI